MKYVSLCNFIFTINCDCVKVDAYNAALFANQPQTDDDALVCSSASLTDRRLHINEAFKYARTRRMQGHLRNILRQPPVSI